MLDQNLCSLHITQQQQLSIDICSGSASQSQQQTHDCCQSMEQTDGRTLKHFMMLTTHYMDHVVNVTNINNYNDNKQICIAP